MDTPTLSPLSGSLTRKQAAHLLRRTTFGPTAAMIQSFTGISATQAVNQLFNFSAAANPPVDSQTGLMFTLPLTGQPSGLNSPAYLLKQFCILWWADLIAKDGASIREKMVFFWHKHIPTIQSRIYNGQDIWYQIALFRHFAKGNFKDLAKAIVTDNAMLMHLNGNQNIAGNPQENFSREFMELFTIGKGPQDGPNSYTNYTDSDVAEGAKVLTGWELDNTGATKHPFNNQIACGKPRANLFGQVATHDNSVKTFSEKFNHAQISPANTGQTSTSQDVKNEKNAYVDMIFQQPETARYLARSFYRYFVYRTITPEVEAEIIVPLGQQIVADNYAIENALKTLLKSQHFFDMDPGNDATIDIDGALIKSPLDLIMHTYRMFEVSPSGAMPVLPLGNNMLNWYYRLYYSVSQMIVPMGMDLYEPVEVAGYQAYFQGPGYNRNWITPTYLANRYKFARDFVAGFNYYGHSMAVDMSAFCKSRFLLSDMLNPDLFVACLAELIFPSALPQIRVQGLSQIILGIYSLADWEGEWLYYDQSGDNQYTEPVLKSLLLKMMQSPEYQLM